METVEGFQILYDEEYKKLIKTSVLPSGDTEIRITTREVTVDDDDINARSGGA
jgi:hypothetical protein